MIDRQSIEADENKRRALVWEVEKKLAGDRVRPIIFLQSAIDLLAALGQGIYDHSEQPLQRLAHGRRLAGPVDLVAAPRGSLPSSKYNRARSGTLAVAAGGAR